MDKESVLEFKEPGGTKPTVLRWEDKVRHCKRWQASGLSKLVYCKQQDLKISTFHGWCNRLWPKDALPGFCQVIAKEEARPFQLEQNVSIELHLLQHQLLATLSLPEHRIVSFIKELSHAAATPR